MGQRSHSKTGVHDADPLLLVAHNCERSFDALAFEFVGCLGLSLVYAFAQDELVNLSHASVYFIQFVINSPTVNRKSIRTLVTQAIRED
jgi:hypothetical protein